MDLRKIITIHHFQGQFLRLILTEVLTLVAQLFPFFSILLEESDSVCAVQPAALTYAFYNEYQ